MSLIQVLDILGCDDDLEVAKQVPYLVQCSRLPELLQGAPDQLKHKYKTRLSALLKSTGYKRALAAYLAASSFADWSVIKSHGASWVQMLLHILGLPDPVAWKPAIQALVTIFSKIRGRQELTREVGSSSITDFYRRLIPLISKIPGVAIPALCTMMKLYPGPARAQEVKITTALEAQFLQPRFWVEAAAALSALPGLDKHPVPAWHKKFVDVLGDIDRFFTTDESNLQFVDENGAVDIENSIPLYERYWALLDSLLSTNDFAVKVPVERLAGTVDKALASLKHELALPALRFLYRHIYVVQIVYLRSLEDTLYRLLEVSKLNSHAALLSLGCVEQVIKAAGWLSTAYDKVIARLLQRCLSLLASPKTSTDGLADFVLEAKASGTIYRQAIPVVSRLFERIIVTCPTLPHTSRSKIDTFFLQTKAKTGLYVSTLYPGKYSILPLSLESGLDGFEALVHPRFPPLGPIPNNTDNLAIQEVIEQDDELDDKDTGSRTIEKLVVEEEVPPTEEPREMPDVSAIVSPQNDRAELKEHIVEESIPAVQPVTVGGAVLASSEDGTMHTDVSPTAEVRDQRPEKRQRTDEAEESDEDDFVIPAIELDSD